MVHDTAMGKDDGGQRKGWDAEEAREGHRLEG